MHTATISSHSPLTATGPVVVGVDDSSEALDALVLGYALSNALGRGAVLAHVHAVHDFEAPSPNDFIARSPSHIQELVGARRLTSSDHAELVPGRSAAKGLRSLAAREDAAAVVVGRGRTGEWLLGRSSVPVVAAPTGYADSTPHVATVGAAFDGSENSRAALHWAAAVARAAGATLRVIGVHEPVPLERLALTRGLSSEPFGAVVREQQERRLAIAAAEVEDGLDVEVALRDGTTVDELVEASRELDLLVVGTRGLGLFRGAAPGRVSAAVMRSAHAPVAAVP